MVEMMAESIIAMTVLLYMPSMELEDSGFPLLDYSSHGSTS